MKLLINDKKRNIYFRKDNTAYYKSGGSENDVTSMFKKTGGGLKKQFSNLLIEGDEKYANMLGGKTKSRKNKLAVGGASVEKNFTFAPISVTHDPNVNEEDNVVAKLNQIKKTHETLLLLSILKTLKHSPTADSADFDSLEKTYNSFDVTAIKESITAMLKQINDLTADNTDVLKTLYEPLKTPMETLMSKAHVPLSSLQPLPAGK